MILKKNPSSPLSFPLSLIISSQIHFLFFFSHIQLFIQQIIRSWIFFIHKKLFIFLLLLSFPRPKTERKSTKTKDPQNQISGRKLFLATRDKTETPSTFPKLKRERGDEINNGQIPSLHSLEIHSYYLERDQSVVCCLFRQTRREEECPILWLREVKGGEGFLQVKIN